MAKMILSSLALAVCLLVTTTKADAPGSSYGAPAEPSYGAPSSYGDSGQYYYYSAPEPEYKSMMDMVMGKDKCAVKLVLPPLILITIFLGLVLLQLVAPTLLPAIVTPFTNPLVVLINAITGGGRSFGSAQRMEIDPEYMASWEDTLNKLTMVVTSVVETDECLQRIVCESGKYMDGRSNFLSIMEIVTPKHYSNQMKVFKESALKKTSCRKYKCGIVDWKNM